MFGIQLKGLWEFPMHTYQPLSSHDLQGFDLWNFELQNFNCGGLQVGGLCVCIPSVWLARAGC